MTPTVAVVGASLAGLSAARALRAQSYDGRVVVVGDERHVPYDRPPLSKEFLAVYERDGRPVAALGMDQPRLFTRWRRQLRTAVPAGA